MQGTIPCLAGFNKVYDQYEPLFMANDLGNELLNSVELFTWSKMAWQIIIICLIHPGNTTRWLLKN